MESGFPGAWPIASRATDTGILYPRAGADQRIKTSLVNGISPRTNATGGCNFGIHPDRLSHLRRGRPFPHPPATMPQELSSVTVFLASKMAKPNRPILRPPVQRQVPAMPFGPRPTPNRITNRITARHHSGQNQYLRWFLAAMWSLPSHPHRLIHLEAAEIIAGLRVFEIGPGRRLTCM